MMNEEKWRETLPRKIIGAKCIVRTRDGKVLLVKPNYRDYWHIPGGGVDAGEAPIDAAIRELKEETGLVVAKDRVRLVDVFHRPNDDLGIIYEYTDFVDENSTITIQPDEIEAYEFVPAEKAAEYFSGGMKKWWIDQYLSDKQDSK